MRPTTIYTHFIHWLLLPPTMAEHKLCCIIIYAAAIGDSGRTRVHIIYIGAFQFIPQWWSLKRTIIKERCEPSDRQIHKSKILQTTDFDKNKYHFHSILEHVFITFGVHILQQYCITRFSYWSVPPSLRFILYESYILTSSVPQLRVLKDALIRASRATRAPLEIRTPGPQEF